MPDGQSTKTLRKVVGTIIFSIVLAFMVSTLILGNKMI